MWGEGIIGAVKMEEMGEPGRVHISDATARLIGEEFSLSVAHEEMEPSFAAGFLARMRSDVAAGIMAGLKPETAYTISVILAGRNAKAPKS